MKFDHKNLKSISSRLGLEPKISGKRSKSAVFLTAMVGKDPYDVINMKIYFCTLG